MTSHMLIQPKILGVTHDCQMKITGQIATVCGVYIFTSGTKVRKYLTSGATENYQVKRYDFILTF